MIPVAAGEVEKVVQDGEICMVGNMIEVAGRGIAVHPAEMSVHHINA